MRLGLTTQGVEGNPQRREIVDGGTPSWPDTSLPQQYGNPVSAIAHVCEDPTATLVKRSPDSTALGTRLPDVVPSPIAPVGLASQQYMVAS